MMSTQLWRGATSNGPTKRLMKPIRNCGADEEYGPHSKPWGGIWTSTLLTGEDGTETSAWVTYCERDYKRALTDAPYSFTLEPVAGARVLEIDSDDDARAALQRYGQPDGRYLDWERIALDYDACHLSEDGVWDTRQSLWGWDAESTIWFRWMFA